MPCLPQLLANLADFLFEWHETTLRKFIDSYSPEIECFELVHFVSSLYYMDAETSLINCYKRLVSGGAIFCTLGLEDSFFPKLSRKLRGLVGLGSTKKIYTEVDFIDIAKRNNWKYEELSKVHYTVDLSSCFDESSTEGHLLLDFLTHKQDFRVTVDRMLYNGVMEFLNDESFSDENGKKLLKPEFIAFSLQFTNDWRCRFKTNFEHVGRYLNTLWTLPPNERYCVTPKIARREETYANVTLAFERCCVTKM